MSTPFPRSLPYVLRDRLNEAPGLKLMIGRVTGTPDARHVTVDIGGTAFTVPKLKSYSAPSVGEPAYLLVGPSLLLAIGTVQ